MQTPIDIDWDRLLEAARAVSRSAHAPYSGFRVGACVQSDDGAMASGCNVENASYGLTICAERSAVSRAIADGARAIVAVALYTPTAEPATPCGACLQVMAEFSANAEIRCYCDGPQIAKSTVRELLPAAFTLASERESLGRTLGSEL